MGTATTSAPLFQNLKMTKRIIMQNPLARVSKREKLNGGQIEFSSDGEYNDQTVILHYNIANRTKNAVYVEWKPITTVVVDPTNPWTSESIISCSGSLGRLRMPVNFMSKAIVTTDGGKNEIRQVPTYLTSSEGFTEFIMGIPHAVIEGAKLIVKYFISGNSPGVVLTGEAVLISKSPFEFRYRYTATAEGDVDYVVEWGSLSSNVSVSKPSEEKIISQFNSTGAVELVNTSVVLTRGDGYRSVTLAPMPFPQQKKKENLDVPWTSGPVYEKDQGETVK